MRKSLGKGNGCCKSGFALRGPGGVDDPGKVKIEFSVVPGRGECQLPDLKILLLAEVIGF